MNAEFQETKPIKATFSEAGAKEASFLFGNQTKSNLKETSSANAMLENNDGLQAEFGTMQKADPNNYSDLYNKPKIEGHTLIGDKTFKELGLSEITPQEIDEIIYGGD